MTSSERAEMTFELGLLPEKVALVRADMDRGEYSMAAQLALAIIADLNGSLSAIMRRGADECRCRRETEPADERAPWPTELGS